MKKFGFALLAVAGLAAAANAQSYAIETRWVAETTSAAQGGLGDQVAAGTLAGDIVVNGEYRQRFALQARLVEVTGQTNYGLGSLSGSIGTDIALIDNHVGGANAKPGAGRATPFTFNTDTATSAGGQRVDSINGFTAAVNAFPSYTWNFGENQPAAPAAAGAGGNFVTVYRVYVEVSADDVLNNAGLHTIVYTPAQLEAGVGLTGWAQVPADLSPPDDFNPSVAFNYSAVQADGLTGVGGSSFNINIVPAPATAALLGLGGLVAARRRRA